MSTKEIPKYDGQYCTSSCGNDYDCPHEEAFDQVQGIVRNRLDFDVKHDRTEYKVEIKLAPLELLRKANKELHDQNLKTTAAIGEAVNTIGYLAGAARTHMTRHYHPAYRSYIRSALYAKYFRNE